MAFPSLPPDSWATQIFGYLGSALYGAALFVSALGGFFFAGLRERKTTRTTRQIESAAEIDAITKRFQTLIDGYEQRVKDLTSEVKLLREEVVALRKALDARRTSTPAIPVPEV
jgi:hypothetical protein